MPTGVLDPSAATSGRAGALSRARRWAVVVLAVAQLVAGAVATAVGDGRPGGASADGLLLAPAGWGLAVWGVLVAGCLAYAAHQLPAARGDDAPYRRVAPPLLGAMAASVAWLVVGLTGPAWVAALVLLGLLVLLAAAYGTALRHRRLMRLPGRVLLLGTLGVGTGWAAVAVPLAVASALADAGLPTGGAAGAAWQAGALLLALGAGAAVVQRWRARAASTLAAVWTLAAVASGTGAREGGALLAAVAAVGAVALLGWALWSRWEDLRRRLETSAVRLRRGPTV